MKRVLLPILFATMAAGCAAEPGSNDGVTDEGVADQSQDLTGKRRHHYDVGVSDVTWHPGCGMVRIDQPPCPVGLTMTYTLNYVDLTFDHEEKVDNATHTLTITVDSWSYATIHPMIAVRPQTIQLSPKDLQMSTQYKVYVRNRRHEILWQGDIATYLAV